MSGKKKRLFDDLLAEDDPGEQTADIIADRQGLLVAPEADEGWMQNRRPDTWKDTAFDAAGAWANSALQGMGINPSETLDAIGGKEPGDRLRLQLQTGRSASPYATGAADIAGSVTTGVPLGMLGVGPAAQGFLGGFGATEGDLGEKVRGGTFGAIAGKVGDEALKGASGVLNDAAERYGRELGERELVRSGATKADLDRLDKLGGRQVYAEGQERLGLTGSPKRTLKKSEKLISDLEDTRAELGAAAPNVDARTLSAQLLGTANKHPGITPMENAAANMSGYVDNISNPQGQALWDDVNGQRKYYGKKTNFTSGTPESELRQDAYTAYNDQMGNALDRVDPGSGQAWRQAGRDENVAIEMGDISRGAVDRARTQDWSPIRAMRQAAGRAIEHPGIARGARNFAENSADLADALQLGTGAAGGRFGAETEERVQNSEETTEAALTLLQSNPRALGKYAYELSEAAASPSRNAVTAAITKLTMTDENFRTNILPQLTLR